MFENKKGQKQESSLETMEIQPNQTTTWLCYRFYKFIIDDSWDIVVQDILVKRNGGRSEENRRINYCISCIAGNEPSIDMKDIQDVCYSLTRIVDYELRTVSVEWKGKGFCIWFNLRHELHSRVTSQLSLNFRKTRAYIWHILKPVKNTFWWVDEGQKHDCGRLVATKAI